MSNKKNPEEPVNVTTEAPGKEKMGRPRKEIDPEKFEYMVTGGATLKFIAGFFSCSEDTIERWCKKTYNKRFADFRSDTKQWRKSQVSNRLFEKAMEGDTKILLFLAKTWLGMNENRPEMENTDKHSRLYEVLDSEDEIERPDDEDDEEANDG